MSEQPLVRMVNISKSFGRVAALKDINFEIRAGEVVGLVGDNGAGKSTLIRILTGIHTPSQGEVYFEGRKIDTFSPHRALELGIESVHQGFGLLRSLSIPRNIFLGEEPVRRFGPFKFLDLKAMEDESRRLLHVAGIRTVQDINSIVGMLSGGQQQAIKIGRTIYFRAKLVILDEPITGLSIRESDHVIEMVEELRSRGIAVIYITHRIDQIFGHCSRIVILEDGKQLGDFFREKTSIRELEDIIRRGEVNNGFMQQGGVGAHTQRA